MDHFGVSTGLFGEGPAERRERLRKLLAELGESAIRQKKEEKQKEQKKKEEVFVLFVCHIVLKNLASSLKLLLHEHQRMARHSIYFPKVRVVFAPE